MINDGSGGMLQSEALSKDLARFQQLFGNLERTVMARSNPRASQQGTVSRSTAQDPADLTRPPRGVESSKAAGPPPASRVALNDQVLTYEERKNRINALARYVGRNSSDDGKEEDTASNVNSDLIYTQKLASPNYYEREDSTFELEDLHNYSVAFHQKSRMLLQRLEA
jgi:hypothetical protein